AQAGASSSRAATTRPSTPRRRSCLIHATDRLPVRRHFHGTLNSRLPIVSWLHAECVRPGGRGLGAGGGEGGGAGGLLRQESRGGRTGADGGWGLRAQRHH